MSSLGGGSFSAREVAYLQSLPAVERVTNKRIEYTEQFKHYVMQRYAAGDSPVAIFRSAGLDSALIGYKRIERCIARWKETVDLTRDIASTDKYVAGSAPYDNNDVVQLEEENWQIDKGLSLYLAQVQSGHYDMLIARQLRRIDELEREVSMLKARMESAELQLEM